MLVVCSCVQGEEGAGRCAGCLLVCARVRGSWSLLWLSARVCLGKRDLVVVLAVCSCVLGEEGACYCDGCLLVCSWGIGGWSLC